MAKKPGLFERLLGTFNRNYGMVEKLRKTSAFHPLHIHCLCVFSFCFIIIALGLWRNNDVLIYAGVILAGIITLLLPISHFFLTWRNPDSARSEEMILEKTRIMHKAPRTFADEKYNDMLKDAEPADFVIEPPDTPLAKLKNISVEAEVEPPKKEDENG